MTNSSDRLDRIERILEGLAQRQEAFEQRQEAFSRWQEAFEKRQEAFSRWQEAISQQQEINTRMIELLGHRVDSNARAIEANSVSIQTLAEVAGRTLRAVDELRERVEEDRVNFREFIERTDTAIAGINATLAALQQMVRDRNGDGS